MEKFGAVNSYVRNWKETVVVDQQDNENIINFRETLLYISDSYHYLPLTEIVLSRLELFWRNGGQTRGNGVFVVILTVGCGFTKQIRSYGAHSALRNFCA